jgi:predicted nuclease with TOPRIM domain
MPKKTTKRPNLRLLQGSASTAVADDQPQTEEEDLDNWFNSVNDRLEELEQQTARLEALDEQLDELRQQIESLDERLSELEEQAGGEDG